MRIYEKGSLSLLKAVHDLNAVLVRTHEHSGVL